MDKPDKKQPSALGAVRQNLIKRYQLSRLPNAKAGAVYDTPEIDVNSTNIQAFPIGPVNPETGDIAYLDLFDETFLQALLSMISRHEAVLAAGKDGVENSDLIVSYSLTANSYHSDLLNILKRGIMYDPDFRSKLEIYLSDIVYTPKFDRAMRIENRNELRGIELLNSDSNSTFLKRLSFKYEFEDNIGVYPVAQLAIDLKRYLGNRFTANELTVKLFKTLFLEFGTEGTVIIFVLAGFKPDTIWQIIGAINSEKSNASFFKELPKYGNYYQKSHGKYILRDSERSGDPIEYIYSRFQVLNLEQSLIDNSSKKLLRNIASEFLIIDPRFEQLPYWILSRNISNDQRRKYFEKLLVRRPVAFKGEILGSFKTVAEKFLREAQDIGDNVNTQWLNEITWSFGLNGIATNEDADLKIDAKTPEDFPLLEKQIKNSPYFEQ